MSSHTDLRLSFPLGIFCMATLSWTLLLALDQSVTPPLLPPHHDVSPETPDEGGSGDPQNASAHTAKDHALKKDPMPYKERTVQYDGVPHHFCTGLDEDIYWNDELGSDV